VLGVFGWVVLSGWVFQVYGLSACLWVGVCLLIAASITTARLAKL